MYFSGTLFIFSPRLRPHQHVTQTPIRHEGEELDVFCRPTLGQPASLNPTQPNTSVGSDWTASPEVCFPHQAASSCRSGPDRNCAAVTERVESSSRVRSEVLKFKTREGPQNSLDEKCTNVIFLFVCWFICYFYLLNNKQDLFIFFKFI